MSRELTPIEALKIKVSLDKSHYGNYLIYVNDMRVIGPSHQGLCKVIEEVETEIKLPSSITKKLKALEIIQKKRVNVDMLMEVKDTNIYNGFACNSGEYRKLTQEEFDLLKEALK